MQNLSRNPNEGGPKSGHRFIGPSIHQRSTEWDFGGLIGPADAAPALRSRHGGLKSHAPSKATIVGLALHDILGREGVSKLRQNVLRLYLIQIKIVTFKQEGRGRKRDAPLHDIIESKGVSRE